MHVFSEDILGFLTSAAGRAVIDRAGKLDPGRPADVQRLRALCTVDQARAVLELVELRRRGRAKFERADEMMFDRVALAQASGQVVAEHKAQRFERVVGGRPVLDLCCGIGGDTIALAGVGEVVAVDGCAVRVRMAGINVGVYGRADRCRLACADVRDVQGEGSGFHLDPDRRYAGRRTVQLDELEPGPGFIEGLLSRLPTGAIKFSPATAYRDLPWAGEIEVVSCRGECKQMVLWTGDLAEARLRATTLPAGVSITDSGACCYDVGAMGEYVYDPDPSVARLRLLPQLAAMLDLRFLAAGQIVLTGDACLASDLATCFQVDEVVGFHRAKLRKHLRRRGIGRVAVKPRGVKVDVDRLAAELSGREGPERAVFLLRLGKKVVAVLARRVPTTEPDGSG